MKELKATLEGINQSRVEDEKNRKEIMKLKRGKGRSVPIQRDCGQNFHITKRRRTRKTRAMRSQGRKGTEMLESRVLVFLDMTSRLALQSERGAIAS